MGGYPTGPVKVGPIPSELERMKWALAEARFVTWAQWASWRDWGPNARGRPEGHAAECECPKCEPGKWK